MKFKKITFEGFFLKKLFPSVLKTKKIYSTKTK